MRNIHRFNRGDGQINKIREILATGVPTIGLFQTQPSVIISEVLGHAGVDWVCIDLQHGAISWEVLLNIIHGLEIGGTSVLVRVPWNDPAQIMRALDLGASGIIVPMISTVNHARQAAEAMRYPPQGIRSFGPIRQLYLPPGRSFTNSIEDSNKDVLCLVMVETAEGLENLDAIAATPGVDGIFLGPADLSISQGVGFKAQTGEAVDRIVAACEKHKIIAGMASTRGRADTEDMLKRGMRLVAIGGDLGYVIEGAKRDVGYAKDWKKEYIVTDLADPLLPPR